MNYQTVRAAGIAGTLEALRRARLNNWEYGGYVMRNPDGTFGYSKIVTSRNAHTVSLGAALPAGILQEHGGEIMVPGHWWTENIAGMFHVHVAYTDGYDQYHEWFSPDDLQAALSTGGFAYLGAAKHGRIFELDARSHKSLEQTAVEKDVDLELRAGKLRGVPIAKGILVYEEGQHAA